MTYTTTALPQLDGGMFLTDGGLETVLIFQHGLELPHFAAFDLLRDAEGTKLIHDYYLDYIDIARKKGVGFILETPTWRANPDWAELLGYNLQALDAINQEAVKLLNTLKEEHRDVEIVISGNIGPRGDGYVAGNIMTIEEAETYHRTQINSFNKVGVQMVTAITMTNSNEAIGIVKAAQNASLPVCIGLTVETDGRLPSGQSLKGAIEEIDVATQGGPAYYMINCAHPDHFNFVLEKGSDWIKRIRSLRCNASKCSHAELDNAEELDDGNPDELAADILRITNQHPQISILGGCCGTDHRHIEAISQACII